MFLNNLSGTASGAVVSKYADTLNIPQWVVQDTTKALGDIARCRRDQFLGPLIALTGSSGCLLYTSPSPRDGLLSRMPSSA